VPTEEIVCIAPIPGELRCPQLPVHLFQSRGEFARPVEYGIDLLLHGTFRTVQLILLPSAILRFAIHQAYLFASGDDGNNLHREVSKLRKEILRLV